MVSSTGSRLLVRRVSERGHEDTSGCVSVRGCQSTAPPVTGAGSRVTVLSLPHTDWVAENREVVSHGSGGRKSGTKVLQGPTPSEGSRGGSFLLLPAAGGPRCSVALSTSLHVICLCHLMALSSMYLYLLLFCLL